MAFGRNCLLCLQHFTAHRTMTSFGLSFTLACCLYCCIFYFGMTFSQKYFSYFFITGCTLIDAKSICTTRLFYNCSRIHGVAVSLSGRINTINLSGNLAPISSAVIFHCSQRNPCIITCFSGYDRKILSFDFLKFPCIIVIIKFLLTCFFICPGAYHNFYIISVYIDWISFAVLILNKFYAKFRKIYLFSNSRIDHFSCLIGKSLRNQHKLTYIKIYILLKYFCIPAISIRYLYRHITESCASASTGFHKKIFSISGDSCLGKF